MSENIDTLKIGDVLITYTNSYYIYCGKNDENKYQFNSCNCSEFDNMMLDYYKQGASYIVKDYKKLDINKQYLIVIRQKVIYETLNKKTKLPYDVQRIICEYIDL